MAGEKHRSVYVYAVCGEKRCDGHWALFELLITYGDMFVVVDLYMIEILERSKQSAYEETNSCRNKTRSDYL